ncbi:FMRFamide-activated amiloride-sensitive sodium channel-like [Tachypleus tridentatus]|uniref:FMRFamide-activated amiloride-sensitive sodium channel-like n=1 Tax=Tachypleus tridentatus TaxID=6853 RepID=UPI003FD1AC21
MVEKNQTTKEDKQFDSHGLFAQRLLLVVTSLASLSCCVYYYGAFLQEYFSYPVVLNVKVNNSGIMLFPGVTICNRHRINKNKIRNLCYSEDGVRDKSLWRACDTILDDFDLNNLHYTNSYYQGFVSPRSLFITCPRNNDDNTTVQKNQDIVNKVDAYLSLTENQRMEISTSLHEILAKCSYEVSDCYSTSFTTFWSFLYGNCFTFNPKRGMKGRDSLIQTTGAMAGLDLTFGVQTIEVSTMDEEDLRLRLVIHSPHAMPDIENDGIDIAQGTSLSMGIEQVDYHRLPEPYSDGCYKDDKNEPDAYNKKQCFQKCLQLLSNETCGCGDPTINLPDGVPPCHLTEANDVCCLDKVMAKLSSDEKTCGCITPCVEYKYTMTISRSSTTWISQIMSNSG